MAEETNQQPADQAAAPAPEQAVPQTDAAPATAASEAPAPASPAVPAPGMTGGGGEGFREGTPMGMGGGGRGGPGGRGGHGGRGGQGGGRGGPGGQRRDRQPDDSGIESSVVRIYRCSKVVKGGRTFSFGALVVAGDRKGNIGIGYGKAKEVPNAVEKASKDAKKSMFKVHLKGTTIPHHVKGTSGASTVVLVPARPGTGVTAGKSVRPCLELTGITDILSKAYGSTSPKNLVKATMEALRMLQSKESVETARGVQLSKGAGELVSA